MKLFSVEAKVGLFVLATIAVLAYMIHRVDPIFTFKDDGSYTLYIYFDSIAGVETKSFVRIAGVNVGRVTDISLYKSKARVTVKVDKGVVIKDDAVATIRAQGLLGEKYIEIGGGTDDRPVLYDGGTLKKSVRPTDIDEVVGKLGEILSDVKAMSSSLKNVLGTEKGQDGMQKIFDELKDFSVNINDIAKENKTRLRAILINIADLTETLKNNSSTIINTFKNFESLSGELNNKTPSIIADLENITDSIKKLLDDENKANIKEIIGNFKKASAKLDDTLDAIKNISKKIEKGEGTVGKLISDEKVYDNFNSALKGVNSFVSKADRLKLTIGFKGEIQSKGDSKGYLSLKLQPKEDRYYFLEITEDNRKKGKTGDDRKLTNLLYTLQFGKLYDNIGLRIGFMESSFAVGADYYSMNNELKLSLDIFNLGGYDSRVNYSEVKLSAEKTFYRYLFVYGGIDEVLNSRYRNMFGGIGLRFEDDDLKTLLGAVGFAK